MNVLVQGMVLLAQATIPGPLAAGVRMLPVPTGHVRMA
jgi:hypothetical protein